MVVNGFVSLLRWGVVIGKQKNGREAKTAAKPSDKDLLIVVAVFTWREMNEEGARLIYSFPFSNPPQIQLRFMLKIALVCYKFG